MAAKKKTAKKTAKKTTKKSAKKSTPKKPVKKAATKKAAAGKAAKPAPAKKAGKTGVSSLDVNMGHVFSLRPRITTSFKPGDFSTAKHRLQEESFANIHDAARAVAEKALDLNHEGQTPGRRRRF